MRITSLGHALFALTMIAIAVMSLMSGGFAPIFGSVPKSTPSQDMLIYLSAVITLASGIGLIWRRTAGPAAFTLFVFLAAWMLLIKLPYILRDPTVPVSYESWGETAVLVAGAWVLFASLAGDWSKRLLGFATGDSGVHLARLLYGLAMIAFGVAHFAYLKLTASLVPDWLPAHEAWAFATGATYIAAGAAILTGVLARLAAALSVLQIGLFTLLIWGPSVASGHPDAAHWSEFVVSWALTAGGLVVAESYRGAPWFAGGVR